MKYRIYNASADKYACNLLLLDIDECKENNPCRNGATCTDLIGGFECKCPSGYHGDTCDQGKISYQGKISSLCYYERTG